MSLETIPFKEDSKGISIKDMKNVYDYVCNPIHGIGFKEPSDTKHADRIIYWAHDTYMSSDCGWRELVGHRKHDVMLGIIGECWFELRVYGTRWCGSENIDRYIADHYID